MPPESHTAAARGALAAGLSFLFWGLWPLYWRQLDSVAPFELIAHRILWSALLLLVIVFIQGTADRLRAALVTASVLGLSLLSGMLLATNWTIYIWAINDGHVIDSSLGYFLTPLCNVALGYFFLQERLRVTQWTAVGFALAGTAWYLAFLGLLVSDFVSAEGRVRVANVVVSAVVRPIRRRLSPGKASSAISPMARRS